MQMLSWRRSLSRLLLALALLLAFARLQPALAAELIMFDLRGCPWCALWHKEIGVGYANTPEGQRAPLRVVDLKAPLPPDFVLDKPVRSSPTFVLVDEGREVGRITGYPGADFFWGLLGELLAKLDAPAAPPAVRAPSQRAL